MGGGNPIKKIFNTVTDVVAKPVREVARAVGADGVVDAVNDVRGFQRNVSTGLIDTVSGKADKMKKEAKAGAQRQAAAAEADAESQRQKAAAAETARVESERMSGGSASKTLLTGPSGLEDEDETTSRKTLRGF